MSLDDLNLKIRVDGSEMATAMSTLTTGIKTSREQIARINTSLDKTASSAGTVSGFFDAASLTITATADATNSLAFVAETTANTLQRLSTTTTAAGQAMQALDKSTSIATNGVQSLATVAKPLAGGLNTVATGSRSLGSGLRMASGGLRSLNGLFAFAGQATRGFATGIAYVATAISAAMSLVTNLAAGLGVVWSGIALIGSTVALSFRAVLSALSVLLLPLKLVIAGMVGLAKAGWAVVQPLASMALTFAKVWFTLKGFIASWKLVFYWISLLPPRLRLVVGGLLALGIGGRAASFSLSVLAMAGRAAWAALQLVALPVLALVRPTMALRVLLINLAAGFRFVAVGAYRAGSAVASFAIAQTIAGFRALGGAVANVGAAMAGKLASGAKSALKTLMLIGVVATGWGVSLASDAEQAQIGFTTMLKSADAAKAVLAELETFAASTHLQLPSLRDGAKQLLNAQVPASELTSRLRTLGDIAAGTGKPIEDFVRIFAKVKSTGKLSLETLNQLAERGVPIYTALADQLGVGRDEMLDMISKGAVGFADLDGALTSLTTGAGVFAGGMAAQAQTLGGLWSTLKDNLSFAVRELGVNMAAAFDFKGLMNRGIVLFQSLRTGLASAMPAFTAVATIATAAFDAIWEVASVVFAGLAGLLGVTSDNWLTSFVEWAAVASFAFKAWPDLAELAFVKLQLWLVQAGGGFAHLFTGILPALFTWFATNWQNIFLAAADLVATVFINIGQNIRNAMAGIWDFIASGGTKSLSIAFVPLLDGFRNTLTTLPNIPDRAIGQLEKSLQADSERLGSALTAGLADEMAANLAMLSDFQRQQAAAKSPTMAGATNPDGTVDETATGTNAAGKSARGNDAAGALDKGSQAAYSAIFAAMRNDQDAKSLQFQQQTARAAQITATAVTSVASAMVGAPMFAFVEALS